MSHIPLATLERMFFGMRHQTGWNPDADLLWGYFFFDSDPQRLTPLPAHLAQIGYRVVETHESDDRTTAADGATAARTIQIIGSAATPWDRHS